MATKANGWSAEMDRKLVDMRRDPEGYTARSRAAARESSRSHAPAETYLRPNSSTGPAGSARAANG
jgi:hypothetical protein